MHEIVSLLTEAPRNPYSSIHPRDPRSSSSLFDNYPGADAKSRPASSDAPTKPGYGYGGNGAGSPYMNGGAQTNGGGFRPATPNSKYVPAQTLANMPFHGFPSRMKIRHPMKILATNYPDLAEVNTRTPSSNPSNHKMRTKIPLFCPPKLASSNNSPLPLAMRSAIRPL